MLRKFSPLRPKLALALGSGFQGIIAEFQTERHVPFERLPGFPAARVEGHRGEVLLGHLGAAPSLVLCGRAHFYEGYPMSTVTFPIRVLAEFGIETLLLTNAAGAINRRFRPGDFMCVSDHINFMGMNPLRGEAIRSDQLSAFVDLSQVYDPGLRKIMRQAALAAKVTVHNGVYLAVSGPSYETPAEIHAFARLGADAVGMSTVPEAVVARQCGMRVAALSCITNRAAGLNRKRLSHADVLESAQRVTDKAARLIQFFAERVTRK
jgi:purine-nucleoside phosphorylase